MSHCYPIDRFTLPGQIPDASHPGWRDGGFMVLREGPGVGHSAPDETRHLSHPAGRGWQPVSRQRLPGDPPEPSSVDSFASLLDEADSPQAVFTRALQVRFLDRLAACGNVRSACAVAGVSPHTAYKARRRDARFARLWDAALLLARPHAEAVLATRALDGVEVPIMFRGEVVGYRRHYDGRLLLAHLGRLDRAIEQAAPAAYEAAERFDELLALHAGAEPDAALYEARSACAGSSGPAGESDLPATREELVRHLRSQAEFDVEAVLEGLDDSEEDLTEEDLELAVLEAECAAMDEAGETAEALWAAWQCAVQAAVDALVEGDEVPPQDGEGDHAEHGGGGSPAGSALAGRPLHHDVLRRGAPPGAGEDFVAPLPLAEEPVEAEKCRSNIPPEPCHPVTPCDLASVPS